MKRSVASRLVVHTSGLTGSIQASMIMGRRGERGCVPFIANRSHLLVPFDILAHSPVHDKQYLTTTINYMLPVAAYKSHNQFSSSGVLRLRCEHSHDPTCQSSNDYLHLTPRRFSIERDVDDNGEEIWRGYGIY